MDPTRMGQSMGLEILLPATDYDIVGSIVLYNTPAQEVAKAIDQFVAVPLRTHLCLIDNSPHPIQLPIVRENLSYHFVGNNLGYGRAHNLAIRAARDRGRYSLIMNTDVKYEPVAVTRLFEYLQAQPQAGLAAPKMLHPDGSLQHVCRLLPTPADFFLRRFMPKSKWTIKANERYELRFWDHNSYANLAYFQGSFLMLRTALANRMGGFDERFFMYGEDIDLCRRVHAVAEAVYVPDATVVHEYRRYSNSSLRGTWLGIQNNARYFNKWGWFVDGERRKVNRQVVRELRQRATMAALAR